MMRAHENIDNVTNVRIDIEHLQENLEKKQHIFFALIYVDRLRTLIFLFVS